MVLRAGPGPGSGCRGVELGPGERSTSTIGRQPLRNLCGPFGSAMNVAAWRSGCLRRCGEGRSQPTVRRALDGLFVAPNGSTGQSSWSGGWDAVVPSARLNRSAQVDAPASEGCAPGDHVCRGRCVRAVASGPSRRGRRVGAVGSAPGSERRRGENLLTPAPLPVRGRPRAVGGRWVGHTPPHSITPESVAGLHAADRIFAGGVAAAQRAGESADVSAGAPAGSRSRSRSGSGSGSSGNRIR